MEEGGWEKVEAGDQDAQELQILKQRHMLRNAGRHMLVQLSKPLGDLCCHGWLPHFSRLQLPHLQELFYAAIPEDCKYLDCAHARVLTKVSVSFQEILIARELRYPDSTQMHALKQ